MLGIFVGVVEQADKGDQQWKYDHTAFVRQAECVE